MPLSRDPERRGRQLANLVPGARTAPPGNRRALRHGAFRTIPRDQLGEELRELYEALADGAPLRAEDGSLPAADEAAVEVAARALKRWREVSTWCDMHGRFAEDGTVKPAAVHELKAETALARALDVLGMTPAARARLGVAVAAAGPTLAELMADDADAEEAEGA